ncbi:MAG: YfcC family protein [Streptosporangiaceae bacterium]
MTVGTQTNPDNTDETPAEPKRGFKFPTAFTVLFFVLVLVWILTFIIPPGTYSYVSCDGGSPKPIPGTFHDINVNLSVQERLYDLWVSPVNGLYGIRTPSEVVSDPNPDLLKKGQSACGTTAGKQVPAEIVTPPGNTGPYNSGDLAGAVQVFFFVLAIGAFITVTIKTGALDAGIGRVTNRFRKRGLLLIVILMAIFSVGGTTYGMAEETLGFYAIILPVIVGLGYDRMVGVGIIMVGAGVGTLASTVNPFATGVASDAAGVALGDGIGLRLIMYAVFTALTVLYVLRYARRVKNDPARSMLPAVEGDQAPASGPAGPPGPMTGRQKTVLWIFGLTFGLMLFSVIPWGDFSSSLESITLGWYFPELAALFIVGAVLVGLVGGLGEEGTVTGIIAGAGDFIGAALIIAVARGVTTIMNNAGITDTVLHALEGAVSGLSSGAFAVVMYLVNIPLAFLVPSSSGHATLAMPIMAPLGDFAGVSRAMVVTAYQSASGWMNLFTPTSAIVMGGLALSRVRYDRYLRFVAPLLGILLVLTCLFMLLGVAVPALGGPVK